MRIAEQFVSINGEGTRAGELAYFVRFCGCNLRCGYCDTMWANEGSCPYEERTPQEILRAIKAAGVTDVTLTGGEPLLQKQIGELLGLLLADDSLRVEVETNGSIRLAPFCEGGRPYFTMDYKLPSSGCEGAMCLENFELLQAGDAVKFVVGSAEDIERAGQIIRRYHLDGKCNVFLSPVFGQVNPADIVVYMKENRMNRVRVQIQLHKVIWEPDRRGV